jgi:hypothetical protein
VEIVANANGGMRCEPRLTITGNMPHSTALSRTRITPLFSWLVGFINIDLTIGSTSEMNSKLMMWLFRPFRTPILRMEQPNSHSSYRPFLWSRKTATDAHRQYIPNRCQRPRSNQLESHRRANMPEIKLSAMPSRLG